MRAIDASQASSIFKYFSPIFAALLSVVLLRFLAREIGARPAFLLLLILVATPLMEVGTILMTIDPPLVLFAGGMAPLTLSFKAAPATFSFDGTASMSENAYFDGQVKFAAPSLRRVLEWSQAGIAPSAAIGSVSISSKVTASAGRNGRYRGVAVSGPRRD